MKSFARLLASIAILLPAAEAAIAQKPFTMPFEQFELRNGMKCVLYRDTTLPVVAINVAYKGGSGCDQPGKSGLANLVGAMLLQGSEHIPLNKFLSVMDECGASFGGSVDVDRIDFWSIFPRQWLETGLWIESDRLGFGASSFTQARLDTARRAQMREAERIDKNPLQAAKRMLYEKIYPAAHPYSWLTNGKPAEVAKLRLADAKNFGRAYIIPNNASITIGGDFDPAAARDLLKKYFEDLPRAAEPRVTPPVAADTPIPSDNISVEENTDRSRLLFAFRTVPSGSADEPALHFIARLLAGDRMARLTRELMVNRRIAIDVQAMQSSQAADGLFWIIVTCKPETNLGVVYDLVGKELDNIAANEVTEDDLATVVNKIAFDSYAPLEKLGGAGGAVDALNLSNLASGNPVAFLDLLHGIERLNRAAVTVTAGRFLKLDRCITLGILPRGKANLGLKPR